MRFVPLVALLAVVACSTDTTDPVVLSATGNWTATVTGDGGSIQLAVNLTQTGATISGSGTGTNPQDPPPAILTVTGTVTGTTVALNMQIQPQVYQGHTVDSNETPVTFSGTLTSTTMTGTMNKAANSDGNSEGFSNLSVTFTKQ